MTRRSGGSRSQAIWLWLAIGVVTAGCQASVSYSVLGVRPDANAQAANRPGEEKNNQLLYQNGEGQFIQAGYQPGEGEGSDPRAGGRRSPNSRDEGMVPESAATDPANRSGIVRTGLLRNRQSDVQPAVEEIPGAPTPLPGYRGAGPESQSDTQTLDGQAGRTGPNPPMMMDGHLPPPGMGGPDGPGHGEPPLPRELSKSYLPPYVIEPPDVLFIDTIRAIPKPPYRIAPLDVLLIQVAEALPGQAINGPYTVTPDGLVSLGFSYGSVRVSGMTLEQAAMALRNHLSRYLKEPQVAVALAQFRGVQQTRGEHLVGMDGTITLGTYGCVSVAGLTIPQAKCAIEKHLSKYLLDPEISLSVSAYNSKVYYVITDGGGFGEQVYRFPITGNETVLDAISNIRGLPPVSSKKKIWLARPTPANHCCYEILPIDWRVITQAGATETNYQLFPGDRIYIKSDCLIAFNNNLTKVLAPIEQIFGAVLLGNFTVRSFSNNNNNNNTGVGAVALPVR